MSSKENVAICWTTVANLLLFFCFAHLGVIASFALGWTVPVYLAPLALIGALVAGDWLGQREGLAGRRRLAPAVAALAILAVSLCLAGAFFDMSWDGEWYHQTAILQMAHGWNPLRDPLHRFIPSLQDYVRFYAKGPWFIALALYRFSPHIEWAKPMPWVSLAAMFLAVWAGLRDLGVRPRVALLVATLVTLNPVAVFELATYLVDGQLIAYLACFVFAMARFIRRPSPLVITIAGAATILCSNTKFSGFVFLCFFAAAGGVYILLRQRRLLWRYVAINGVAFLLATCVFGFNPYVTNTVERGHPFYPWFGTAQYPSYAQRGADPNDRYETPKNLLGHNRLVRFTYALFGRPSAAPYYPDRDAHLMWPFDVSARDFAIFYFHDVRIGGFGPLFSGAFLIALVLLGATLARPGLPRLAVILALVAIVASVLIGLHLWWARYGPQLWWLPVMAVWGGLSVPGWRWVRWASWGLAGLLLVNAVAIEARHFVWEFESTQTMYRQMATLRGKGEIEIDFQYFLEPYEERLRAGGVSFHPTRRLSCPTPMELMSVPHGYPGAVRACVP